MKRLFDSSVLRVSLAIGAIVLGTSAPAQAIVFDFKHTGGTSAPGNKLLLEVTENLSTPANDVLLKVINQLPIANPLQPPSIGGLYLDTGSNTSLFSGSLSIVETFGQVKLVPKVPATTHPFLPANFTPEFRFGLDTVYPFDTAPYGINPGEYAVMSATLGGSKTFADLIGAMNQGLTATTGLRIGVVAYFLKGTGRDDGGFITNSVVAVPEPEVWAMMLAGFGLVGAVAYRRRVWV